MILIDNNSGYGQKDCGEFIIILRNTANDGLKKIFNLTTVKNFRVDKRKNNVNFSITVPILDKDIEQILLETSQMIDVFQIAEIRSAKTGEDELKISHFPKVRFIGLNYELKSEGDPTSFRLSFFCEEEIVLNNSFFCLRKEKPSLSFTKTTGFQLLGEDQNKKKINIIMDTTRDIVGMPRESFLWEELPNESD